VQFLTVTGNSKFGCKHLVEMLASLRAPDGCPWDREQTHETLRRYLIEESYEAIEAIDNNDMDHLKEELGDVLLQVVFHAQIAEESGAFNFNDVVESIVTKLERRHPHVFGDIQVSSADEVAKNWEAIKAEEKKRTSVLSGIPEALPGLLHAYKLQRKAARVGFDWPSVDGALDKIKEEIDEIHDAREGNGHLEEEIGDVLFAIVNVARHYEIDPELALKRTCSKFERRFGYMEDKAASENTYIGDLSLEEQDELWNEAKAKGL
jgi:tetrapyrrole methylase family protein/MazG family protein